MLPQALGPTSIEGILAVEQFNGPPLGEPFVANSLPGHLLHYVLEGAVRQQCNGRTYELCPGSVLWYHEDEWVEGATLKAPWRFYSINFIAPSMPPPPYEARLFSPSGVQMRQNFDAMFAVWNDATLGVNERSFRVHALLLQILAGLSATMHTGLLGGAEANLWWQLELQVRRDLARPVNLRQLEIWAGCSAATVARAAQAAVGQSPMRRIKEIRLSFARGLVQRSGLTFSQIAGQIGYPRVQEFSRDYKAFFGAPPSSDPSRKSNRP